MRNNGSTFLNLLVLFLCVSFFGSLVMGLGSMVAAPTPQEAVMEARLAELQAEFEQQQAEFEAEEAAEAAAREAEAAPVEFYRPDPAAFDNVRKLEGFNGKTAPVEPEAEPSQTLVSALIAGVLGVVIFFGMLLTGLVYVYVAAPKTSGRPQVTPAMATGSTPQSPPAAPAPAFSSPPPPRVTSVVPVDRAVEPAPSPSQPPTFIGAVSSATPTAPPPSQFERAVEIGATGAAPPPAPAEFDEYGRPLDYEGESHTGYYLWAASMGFCALVAFVCIGIGPMRVMLTLGLWYESTGLP